MLGHLDLHLGLFEEGRHECHGDDEVAVAVTISPLELLHVSDLAFELGLLGAKLTVHSVDEVDEGFCLARGETLGIFPYFVHRFREGFFGKHTLEAIPCTRLAVQNTIGQSRKLLLIDLFLQFSHQLEQPGVFELIDPGQETVQGPMKGDFCLVAERGDFPEGHHHEINGTKVLFHNAHLFGTECHWKGSRKILHRHRICHHTRRLSPSLRITSDNSRLHV